MQLNLTGHHMDITPALRSYIESKFERLERHFEQMTNVHVILSIEKERQKAEATIHVNRGNIYAVHAFGFVKSGEGIVSRAVIETAAAGCSPDIASRCCQGLNRFHISIVFPSGCVLRL